MKAPMLDAGPAELAEPEAPAALGTPSLQEEAVAPEAVAPEDAETMEPAPAGLVRRVEVRTERSALVGETACCPPKARASRPM